MARPVGRGISDAALLLKFGYCLTDEGVAPTADLHGRYPPSTVVFACMANELWNQYGPEPIGDVLGIKVFPVDDHRLLAVGFRDVSEDCGINVVEVAHSLDGLIDRFLEVKPDVLVIDVRFDSKDCGENGLDVCEELLAHDPLAKITVSNQFDGQYVIECPYELSVLASVHRNESTEVFNKAINTVTQDKEYLSPGIVRLPTWSAVKDRNLSRLPGENEMRVFSLAADGVSIIEIVTAMDLSTKIIGHLVKGVKAKLGVESQADITELAIRHGTMTTAPKTKS